MSNLDSCTPDPTVEEEINELIFLVDKLLETLDNENALVRNVHEKVESVKLWKIT